MKKNYVLHIVTGSILLPTLASAHTIGGNGFVSGVLHPLTGVDHLLAMVAVGILSAILGGKAAWKLPLIFVSCMILGGALGISGIPIFGIEQGIALSVLLFGLMIAISKHIPLSAAIIATIIFALMHGHAHGAEMPQITHPLFYITGFVLSTTTLHIAGALIGYHAQKHRFSLSVLRYAGVSMSLLGLLFLTSAV